MWWNKTTTINFHHFMQQEKTETLLNGLVVGISPPSNLDSMLDGGLMLFGGMAAAVLGLVILEKLGYKVDSGKVLVFLQVIAWIGLVWLGLKLPLWSLLR